LSLSGLAVEAESRDRMDRTSELILLFAAGRVKADESELSSLDLDWVELTFPLELKLELD